MTPGGRCGRKTTHRFHKRPRRPYFRFLCSPGPSEREKKCVSAFREGGRRIRELVSPTPLTGVDHSTKGVDLSGRPRNGGINAFSIRSVPWSDDRSHRSGRSVAQEPRSVGMGVGIMQWFFGSVGSGTRSVGLGMVQTHLGGGAVIFGAGLRGLGFLDSLAIDISNSTV